jgi:crooked neck
LGAWIAVDCCTRSPWSCRRCRTLQTWCDFVSFEQQLAEVERARQIYELAVSDRVQLDSPQRVWRAYIDFESSLGEIDSVVSLYERLLMLTSHVRVWISYAQFLAGSKTGDEARAVFERANKELAGNRERAEERVTLIDSWCDFEDVYGDEESKQKVVVMVPKKVTRKRLINVEGSVIGETVIGGNNANQLYEEYIDYIFPDDVQQKQNFKLLEIAKNWKKRKVSDDDDDDDDDEDDGDDDNDDNDNNNNDNDYNNNNNNNNNDNNRKANMNSDDNEDD